MRDYVVWDAEPATPAAFVGDVVRARQAALSAPCGPAYVSLDAAVQEMSLDAPVSRPSLARHAPAPRRAPDPDAVSAAADLLARAERPVVVAGRVSRDATATKLVASLVELLGAAYHDDCNAVVLPTDHPQNLTGSPEVLRDADVVVAVDVVDLSALLRPRGRGRGDGHGVEHSWPDVVDVSHGDLGARSWSNAFGAPFPRAVAVQGDPLLGAAQLSRALEPLVDPQLAARRGDELSTKHARLRHQQQTMVRERWDEVPVSPTRMVGELWEAVRGVPHLLCLRNTRSWPEGVWKFPGAGSYLGHSGGGGVGYGPGALAGGALAARDSGRLGVGIIGDGDLLMAAGALWTAVHYRIPLLAVVNDNGSFYNDEEHQAAVARQRRRPAEHAWIGMRVAEPRVDIAALARSYGAHVWGPVEDPDQLAKTLREAREAATSGAVAVVPVRTGPR